MAALIVQTGKHKGKKITLPTNEVFIGRGDDCFVRLASEEVSRHHCSIVPTSRGVRVRDLGSQNGTLVNSVPIETEIVLQPGDLLQIGPILFQLAGQRPRSSAVDDEVAGWLTESDTKTEIPNVNDTTIVRSSRRDAAATTATATASTNSAAGTGAAVAAKPKFNTLAEEAQDIIRRWREKAKGQG